MDTKLVQRAAEKYVTLRDQTGDCRKAAAHVVQEFGVETSDLTAYLAEHRMLLKQQVATVEQTMKALA